MEIEADLVKLFAEHALIHIPPAVIPNREQYFEWWMAMQHHGGPTRVLDWTTSPYVAAYFAVVNHWECDGAVWLISPAVLMEDAAKKLGAEAALEPAAISPGAPEAVVATRPRQPVERMIAQQGHCTVALNVLTRQDEAIGRIFDAGGIDVESQFCERLVIPTKLKPEFLVQLRRMNITAAALFPGLDGLGRSLAEVARLAPIFRG